MCEFADDAAAAVVPAPPPAVGALLAASASPPVPPSVPLAVLQMPADKLPAGVDASERQNYLSAAEFQSVFGMDKAAFDQLPGWKRMAAKKNAHLF